MRWNDPNWKLRLAENVLAFALNSGCQSPRSLRSRFNFKLNFYTLQCPDVKRPVVHASI